MSENNSSNSSGGCGCLGIIILIITVGFFLSIVKNCNGSVYESTIKTTKDYIDIADSIWHQK